MKLSNLCDGWRPSNHKNKTVTRPYYLCNGNLYSGSTVFSYWNISQGTLSLTWINLTQINLIPVWISTSIHYKLWGEATYPFPNFNDARISYLIPPFLGLVIIHPCWNAVIESMFSSNSQANRQMTIPHINVLVQNCSNSSALAMELLQFCIKPLICPLQPTPIYHNKANITFFLIFHANIKVNLMKLLFLFWLLEDTYLCQLPKK